MNYVGYGKGQDGIYAPVSGTFDPGYRKCGGHSGTNIVNVSSHLPLTHGDLILIWQTQGANAGLAMFNIVQSSVGNTITTLIPLNGDYDSNDPTNQAQVVKVPSYSEVTINEGVTLSCRNWDLYTGGVLPLVSTTRITINGTIRANGGHGIDRGGENSAAGGIGAGFKGGDAISRISSHYCSFQGDSHVGRGIGGHSVPTAYPSIAFGASAVANGPGGGGGCTRFGDRHADGGGAGYVIPGGTGSLGGSGSGDKIAGAGGTTIGEPTLERLYLSAGGGGSQSGNSASTERAGGGSGAGIIILIAPEIVIGNTASLQAIGGNGGATWADGGGGAGGTFLLMGREISLNTNKFNVSGGKPGFGLGDEGTGTASYGRIRVEGCRITGSINSGSVSIAEGGHPFCGTLSSIIE